MSTDTNDTVENVPLAAPVTVHAAILARKSTEKQATSIERQIADARFFAAAKGWEVGPQHVYSIDEGVSGTLWNLDDRPDLKAMLEAVQNGEVKHVVVQQLDRLTRDQILATIVLGTLGRYGVTVWCYSTNTFYDLSTPESLMMAQFVAYSGQVEVRSIRNRTRESVQHRARNGRPLGNKLYGYAHGRDSNGGATEFVDVETAPIVQEIFSAYAEGVGLKKIARRLNTRGVPPPRGGQWLASTIRSMLENTKYKGLITTGRFTTTRVGNKKRGVRAPTENHLTREAPNLQIVDPAVWDRCAERFANNKRPGEQPGRPRVTMLSGVLRCGICGSAMHASGLEKYKRYACGKRLAGAVNCANATRRPLHGINRDVVAALTRLVSSDHFEAALAKQLAADRSNVDQRRLEYQTTRGALDAQRAKLQKKVTNLLGELEDMEDPEVRAQTRKRVEALGRERTDVDRQLARLVEPRESSDEDIAALRAEAGRMTAVLEGALTNDPAEAQRFFTDVLEGPIVATPIEVNGEMRFLLRGTLRTAPQHLVARAAIQGGATTVNSDGVKKVGDPKGIFAELEAALVVEVVG